MEIPSPPASQSAGHKSRSIDPECDVRVGAIAPTAGGSDRRHLERQSIGTAASLRTVPSAALVVGGLYTVEGVLVVHLGRTGDGRSVFVDIKSFGALRSERSPLIRIERCEPVSARSQRASEMRRRRERISMLEMTFERSATLLRPHAAKIATLRKAVEGSKDKQMLDHIELNPDDVDAVQAAFPSRGGGRARWDEICAQIGTWGETVVTNVAQVDGGGIVPAQGDAIRSVAGESVGDVVLPVVLPAAGMTAVINGIEVIAVEVYGGQPFYVVGVSQTGS